MYSWSYHSLSVRLENYYNPIGILVCIDGKPIAVEAGYGSTGDPEIVSVLITVAKADAMRIGCKPGYIVDGIPGTSHVDYLLVQAGPCVLHKAVHGAIGIGDSPFVVSDAIVGIQIKILHIGMCLETDTTGLEGKAGNGLSSGRCNAEGPHPDTR